MSLTPGTRLGAYEIVALLGKGGMGEVFRARDTKLSRDVALKLLPDAFGGDPDRLARFRREAQLLASLNHPHIASIYGLEEGDGKVALVLELVEGQGLDDRLRAGAIPLDEALRIARQIALGLEAAHDKGIIHRDLKPANVRLTLDGDVKLLDFGLAKAWDGDDAASGELSQSPTLSRRMTEAGLILGTAAYMSPEQARGKKVDKRADVWAFGVVLFEMLTGRKLFEGETVSDTLAAVLRQEVEWDRLPAETPVSVRRVLRRCLERDPKQRLHDIGDARLDLEEKAEALAPPVEARTPRPSRWPLYAASALAAAFGLLFLRSSLLPEKAEPVTRLNVELLDDDRIPPLWGPNVVLSPDGRTLAWIAGDRDAGGGRRLFVQRLDEAAPTLLSSAEGVRSPVFSPDGRQIAYFATGLLMRVGIDGGAPSRICAATGQLGRGLTWTDKDEIVFTAGFDEGLKRVAASGGEPRPVTTLDRAAEERSHRWPASLPGGESVLFVTQHVGEDYDHGDIEMVSLESGARTVLVHGGTFPRSVPGLLLYIREGALLATPFDAARPQLLAPGRKVLDGILSWTSDQEGSDGSADLSLSASGTLVYRASSRQASSGESHLVWVAPDGKETKAFDETMRVLAARLSPDGTKVLFVARSSRGIGLFLRDLERGTSTSVTGEGSGDLDPVWSPDGRRIAFSARQGSGRVIRIRTLDGSAPDRDLPSLVIGSSPRSWSPDGRVLLVDDMSPETQLDVYAVPLEGEGKPWPIAQSPLNDSGGQFSPNGRYVAYVTAANGSLQVYATPLRGGPRWLVSAINGTKPRWSRDGRRIFFAQGSAPYVADVEEREGVLRFGVPRPVPGFVTSGPPGLPNFDIHPDGRFLLLKAEGREEEAGGDPHHAVIVFNWLAELRRLMRENAR